MCQGLMDDAGAHRVMVDDELLPTTSVTMQTGVADVSMQANPIDVEVAIIGNGPAGIFLSFLLAGNWPYYSDAEGPHPTSFLHNRLAPTAGKLSVLEQDLEMLSEGLSGRSSNPVSVLFDTLHRPNADMGDEERSRLEWRKDASRGIAHVVLGSGPVGGSWRDMHPSMCSLSCGEWMGLPAYSVSDWYREMGKDPASTTRMQRGDVGLYYDAFVRTMGMSENFMSGVVVESVVPAATGSEAETSRRWIVRGRSVKKDAVTNALCSEPILVYADKVVLATGTFDTAKRMGIEGEDHPFVHHRLRELSCADRPMSPVPPHAPQRTLVVVGGGLAAADAVLLGLAHGMRVVHAFLENPLSPSYVIAGLPRASYPDYHHVLSLMRGAPYEARAASMATYEKVGGHRLVRIDASGRCMFRRGDGDGETVACVDADEVAVMIGIMPCLTYLDPQICARLPRDASLGDVDWKKNPVAVDPFSFETDAAKGLFAIGPLAGDNFVRFVLGGPVGVASHIVRTAALNG